MINTIKLQVELEDSFDDIQYKKITLPCNLRTELDERHDYIIVSCEPDISIPQNDDIKRLNDVLDEINSENPEMTAYHLKLLLKASGMELFDDEFVRKVEENDFLFINLSDIHWRMTNKEIAACYLVQELGIPFDRDMGKEAFTHMQDEQLTDYINWVSVWDLFEANGFTLVEDDAAAENELYLIYWK